MAASLVKSAGATVDNNTVATVAFTGNVTAGNRVVALAVRATGTSLDDDFTAGSCTKSAGTATIGAITLDRGDGISTAAPARQYVGIWSALVTGTGTLTFQITAAEGYYWVVACAEVSGTGGMAVGQVNSATNTTGALDSGSVTPAAYQSILLGMGGSLQDTNTAYAQDAAFTSIYEEPNGLAHQTGEAIYRILSSGSDSASWTAPTTFVWVAAVVSYNEIGAGGNSSSVSPSVSPSISLSPSRSPSPSSSLSASPSQTPSSSPSPSPAGFVVMERTVFYYVD